MRFINIFILFTALTGCTANYSPSELRSQYQRESGQWRDGPRKLSDSLFDRFGGTRPAVFGFIGDIAIQNADIFQSFVNEMPRAAVINAENAEFFFVVDERIERGEKIIRKQSYIQEIRVQIVSRRAVSRGSRIIKQLYANGKCLKSTAFISFPPSCTLNRSALIKEALRGI